MTNALQHYDAGSGAGAPYEELRSVLVAGEEVVACALQHRLYALIHRRHVAAATTGRFIFMTRALLGGYEPTSVRWQDLKEVRFSVGMFTAAVTIVYNANLSDTATDETTCAPSPPAASNAIRRRRSTASPRARSSPGARNGACAR